ADIAQSVASLFNTHQHIYDDDFVDLMYAICSKVRGEPMLLNIFFQDRKWLKSIEQQQQRLSASTESLSAMLRSVESLRNESSSGDSSSPSSPAYEFLLFSHLLQFVHLEGKAGDTARTSLLFLLELATTEIMASTGGNTALERFILDDSGFAAILSATLGAMYSQLPRSLRVSTSPSAVVPESFPSYSADLQNAIESSIFASSGADRRSMDRWTDDRGPMDSSNPEFRARLASFVHVLSFIQEVLFRCPSPHVCDQLLKNLHDNFLQAILYPSLLESSDTDGSSVAVMRYLEAMLQSARHEDLVSAIMDFLTDDSSASDTQLFAPTTTTTIAASRSSELPATLQQPLSSSATRASATTKQADVAAATACLPFTLRDLVYSNLQSSVSTDAVVSALNLLRLVLIKHCRYSSRLIEVERVQPSGLKNGWMTNCTVAIDVHRQELDMYAKLMARLQSDNNNNSSNSYSVGGGGAKRDMADVDSQALHIPWRQGTLPRGMASFGDRPRFEMRAAVPESFSLGYDEYLEDAALEWDAHQAYHAELDALFAAQAARSALLKSQPKLPSIAATGVAQAKQRRMRPRKYSEAVSTSVGSRPGFEPTAESSSHTPPSSSASPDTAAPKACAQADAGIGPRSSSLPVPAKRAKHSIKQSDPIVRALMSLLTKYFAQPRECNLALTGVLAALVGCPHRTLDLWLGFNIPTLLNGVLNKPWCVWLDNLRNISDDERAADDSDSEGEVDPRGARRPGGAPAAAIVTADASKYVGLDRELQVAVRALPSGATPPSLYLVISGLVQQAMILQNEIPDFSRRLKRARNALMGIVEDVDDLDEELESTGSYREVVLVPDSSRSRDRGLSSASLENARSLTMASTSRANATSSMADGTTVNAQNRSRNRSASGATSVTRQPGSGGESHATQNMAAAAAAATASKLSGARGRAGSVGQTSEMTSSSMSSVSAVAAASGVNGKASAAAGLAGTEAFSSPASPAAHALSVPPANANLAEFLENVIILQESIKEIIARVQVRRENGGDEDAVS
ncbi:hypothetical protein IWW47_002441, partial [Coemansia sp. RSA 2052]